MTDTPTTPAAGPPESEGARSAGGSKAGSTSASAGAGAGFWPEDYTPTRADRIALTLIAVSGVYGIVMMLARPTLLGFNPLLLACLTGSRSALVTIGALAATGGTSLSVVGVAFVVASFSLIKLDLLFWWAGSLWGDFFIRSITGSSKGALRRAERAEGLARRYHTLAVLITNIPILPIPRAIVFAVLGTAGTSFRAIFAVDLAAAAVVQGLWLYLGYTVGEPVVQVVEVIAKYSLWITLVILAGVILGGMRKARREQSSSHGDNTV
ncbi:DedA family protein [Gephyromycinifex aptenodytis]|uniref:DedA family protein n=1 Tax=Gephyromycinifex aptenodytis TaxID=2716227 RepID=UPI00144771E8|nr:hypothetical protein [Gephyromycinifex aptenodytis]